MSSSSYESSCESSTFSSHKTSDISEGSSSSSADNQESKKKTRRFVPQEAVIEKTSSFQKRFSKSGVVVVFLACALIMGSFLIIIATWLLLLNRGRGKSRSTTLTLTNVQMYLPFHARSYTPQLSSCDADDSFCRAYQEEEMSCLSIHSQTSFKSSTFSNFLAKMTQVQMHVLPDGSIVQFKPCSFRNAQLFFSKDLSSYQIANSIEESFGCTQEEVEMILDWADQAIEMAKIEIQNQEESLSERIKWLDRNMKGLLEAEIEEVEKEIYHKESALQELRDILEEMEQLYSEAKERLDEMKKDSEEEFACSFQSGASCESEGLYFCTCDSEFQDETLFRDEFWMAIENSLTSSQKENICVEEFNAINLFQIELYQSKTEKSLSQATCSLGIQQL